MLSVLPSQQNLFTFDKQNNYLDETINSLEISPELQHKFAKLDMTKYDSYKDLSIVYTLKSIKYQARKEFELDFFKNPDDYAINIIVNNKSRFASKNTYVVFDNENKLTTHIEFFKKNSKPYYKYSINIATIWYNNIPYCDYAYSLRKDIGIYFDEISRFRLGNLIDTFRSYNIVEIYNGNLSSVMGRITDCLNRFVHAKSNRIDKYYSIFPDKINDKKVVKCHLNNQDYDSVKYNLYANIDIYTRERDILGKKSIITTYGTSWSSTTINNFFEKFNTKKTYVSRYTNTDSTGAEELDLTISSSNNLLALSVNGKKIDKNNMIGYKIVRVEYEGETRKAVLEMKIPEDAKIAYNDDKFRCDKCIPLSASIVIDGELKKIDVSECISCIQTSDFIYTIGKECVENSFNGDLNEVCVPGIHYYQTKEKAIDQYGDESLKTLL